MIFSENQPFKGWFFYEKPIIHLFSLIMHLNEISQLFVVSALKCVIICIYEHKSIYKRMMI
ncbi:hypothetical protein AT15_04220 [Kosmotoga arenicorallina S304]|uniref:Uncharacterized protein n=1 Tax=Kosmotoga arenicorallina S304 TaxID=1453497 RepID=A0A176JYQ0_9BACT|nr:hypothetical protein AT15_04220 [Kosmotoga arenicorallina S304]